MAGTHTTLLFSKFVLALAVSTLPTGIFKEETSVFGGAPPLPISEVQPSLVLELMSTDQSEQQSPEPTTTSILSLPSEYRIKHADLWFCDGSVVLQADSTLFRVHKSQLSRRSVVFSDMFTLPQPTLMTTHAMLADETYEGCPVVRLYDSAEDVANLLLALYDGPFVLPSYPETLYIR